MMDSLLSFGRMIHAFPLSDNNLEIAAVNSLKERLSVCLARDFCSSGFLLLFSKNGGLLMMASNTVVGRYSWIGSLTIEIVAGKGLLAAFTCASITASAEISSAVMD